MDLTTKVKLSKIIDKLPKKDLIKLIEDFVHLSHLQKLEFSECIDCRILHDKIFDKLEKIK